jgi:hypothetical protein
MKTLIRYGLWVMAMMNLTSCDLFFDTLPPKTIVYNLGFNFQDSTGNDLVKGIGLEECISSDIAMKDALSGTVNRDFYVLDIIVSEPCMNWDNEIYNAPASPGFEPDVNRPKLTMNTNNGTCYLNNIFSVPADDCPEQEILTYKLKCPYVFGDEAVHEFVTYWDIPKTKTSSSEYFAKCYRIEFEGNEITPKAPRNKYGYYVAIIVLNNLQK